MKIGIELRQVTFGSSGGLAQHLCGLLRAAFRHYSQHQFVAFTTIFSRSIVADAPANVTVQTVPQFRFFQHIDEAYNAGQIDVLFRTFPMEATLQLPWDRQIMMIPDLQHETFPEFFPGKLASRRQTFNLAMARCSTLVTSTDFVRQTILNHEYNRCRNIFLAPPVLADDAAELPELSDRERRLIPDTPFFYYPANLWPHKNHRRIIAAFEKALARTGQPLKLIFTGHPQGWAPLRDEFASLPLSHLGFVRPALVKALLAKAVAVPFFSLFEGFGIPLLEAFAASTPVICSETTSLPEVGGDAVLTCDPTDVEAMSQLMQRMLSDFALRNQLISRGRARLGHYSSQTSAKGLIDACEHAAHFTRPSISVSAPPPLVSIVTPSYNQGRFLRATIDSILAQDYPHIEYMVFDGGSTDESVDVLKSYGDRFFWKSQRDKGQSDAVNQGLAKSRGEIVTFINSDDILLPGAVSTAVRHFQTHPESDMVYGRGQYIDAAGTVTGMYRTDEYSFWRLMHDCCVCQPAAFWRSRIMRKIGFLDASLHYSMDFDYWLKIDRAGGRIDHIHDILAQSRLHPDAKTISSRQKIYNEIFLVCMRNGGYVDFNYFEGMWHHRVHERRDGWPRYFKFAPGAFLGLAWAHYSLFETRRRGLGAVGRQVANNIISSVLRAPLAGPAIAKGLNALRPTLAPPRIEGLYSDNWMQPESQIIVKRCAAGQKLRHVGIAPVDMKVTISAENKILGNYSVVGGQLQAIGQDIELGSNGLGSNGPVVLQFKFSQYTVDAVNRRLSFLVTDTNLFGEDDL